MHGDLSSCESRIAGVLVVRERRRASVCVEELLDSAEEARFAAAIFAPDEKATRLAKFEIVKRRVPENLGSLTPRFSRSSFAALDDANYFNTIQCKEGGVDGVIHVRNFFVERFPVRFS